MSKLTPKQEKFVQLYHKSGNSTQSYINAGYQSKGKSAEVNASRLLSSDKVRARLEYLRNKAEKAHTVSVKELIELNVSIAFSKLSNVLEITSDGNLKLRSDADLDALDGISISESDGEKGSSRSLSVKRSDRIKASQEIARLMGAYDKKGNDDSEDEGTNVDSILQSIENFTK